MPEMLHFCGCCEGVEKETPVSIRNRPGLSALAYRVGTHGRFKESMKRALSEQPALTDLTTRADDDPTVALIDAWAAVLDVLSFYQERIANEGFLRTATARRSVLELARRIGYELRPGVAAGTWLAFALKTGPGAPESATVPVGTRAQSLPGQDETPQTFETVEAVEARTEWQEMRARQRAPAAVYRGLRSLWLEGVDNNLSVGDALLLVGEEREGDPASDRWDFRQIAAVELDRDRGLTGVEFEYGLGSWAPFQLPSADPTVYVLRKRAALFGHNAPDWNAMPQEIRDRYLESADPTGPTDDTDPDFDVLDQDWPGLHIRGISGIDETDFDDGPVYLDAVYPEIVAGSWAVLERPGYAELYRVDRVTEDARTEFTLSTKATRLELVGENLSEQFDAQVRQTVVFAASEALERAEAPLEEPVEGGTVVLSEPVDGLAEGRLVAVSGTDVDTGEEAAEVATIAAVDEVDGLTRLTFERPLAHRYAREDRGEAVGIRLNANVAPATHGKSVDDEVLGSGDGAKTFQRFTLAHTPLTHVSASTASGTKSTLEVRVDGVLWEEVPSLYGQAPDARVYVTRLADDGTVTVLFGDGRSGARLPSGVENVTASYRHGLGLEGLVDAEQISLLMTRPLGVDAVENPVAPTGADDPERLDAARENAPLTVLTLDRIVSVRDFEDFAAAFAGIGKAQATVLWSGERRLVHLTIASADGSGVPDDSALFDNLVTALDNARPVDQEVIVESYAPLSFGVEARLTVDEDHVAEEVRAEAEAALLDAFSFRARAFGEDVTTSEVLAVIQDVEGVVAVDLDGLGGRDPFESPRLPARPARWEGGEIRPADLLLLAPDGVDLTTGGP